MPIFVLSVFLLFAFDQLTKSWVRAFVLEGDVYPLVPHFFDLVLTPNKGMAFGTLATMPAAVRVPVLLVVPLVVVATALVYGARASARLSRTARVGLVLVLGGALGNLADRLVYGQVTDFVRFRWFDRTLFINNVADDFITVGGVLLALAILRKELAPGARPGASGQAGPAQAAQAARQP